MKVSNLLIAAVIGLLSSMSPVRADDAFPSRPIHLIVPSSPGGGMDTVGRLLGRALSTALGQPIIVDNRPGAGDNIGIAAGAKATPDGYTLLLASNTITMSPSLFKNLGYDTNKDLLPIGKVASLPLLIVVQSSASFKTLPELIAYAKENPDKLSYGSPGTGTPHHLGMELLKSAAGIQIQHVPYKGTAPGVTDLLSGTIPLLVSTISPVDGYLQSGKFHALATLHPTRLTQFPSVPAADETLPDFHVDIWHAVFAPAATPPEIVGKLTTVLESLVKDPGLAAQFIKIGVLTSWEPPAELRTEIKDELAQWAATIKKAGIEAK
jgi:tripartite-type tricarboxylate transporter receptor subunit TctC